MRAVLRTEISPKWRIALSFPSGVALAERIYQGIAAYAKECGGWNFTRHPEIINSSSTTWLRSWQGDGAFIFATTTREAALARSLRLPVVNLASHLTSPRLPTVSVDHYEVGRLAARHLLSKNFRRLAYYGVRNLHYSNERLRGFREEASPFASVHEWLVPLPGSGSFRWGDQEKAIDRWLNSLVRPIGIFASTDLRAALLLTACERLGIKVPHEIAILGVDNDPLVCELNTPNLSSVSRNDLAVGRQAAMLLELLIRQKTRSSEWLRLPPDGVLARESTRTLAVEDPVIAEAVEHIQTHLEQSFGAEEIVRRVPLSRRHFESRFRLAVGLSPYAFINNLRVERAKSLLALKHDRPSITEIARSCGFNSETRFRLVFRRTTGFLPSAWIRQNQSQLS